MGLRVLYIFLLAGVLTGCRNGDPQTDTVENEAVQSQGAQPVPVEWREIVSQDCQVRFSGPSESIFTESTDAWDVGTVRINKYEFDLLENNYIFWCARVQAPTVIPNQQQRLLALLRGWGIEDETLSDVEYLGYDGFESLVDGPFDLAGDNVVRGFQMGNTFVILAAFEGPGESHMQRFFDSLSLNGSS